jgi:hypothetical protein
MSSLDKHKKWTIQIFYNARTDNGSTFRATSVFHTEAKDIGSAYRNAEKIFNNGQKLGAILSGHHLRFP